MKAVANKFNDKWIAEVFNEVLGFVTHSTRYPIAIPSHIEWLEKNNMDGKEVEGSYHQLEYGNPMTDYVSLTIPPIHSDSAGEEISIEKRLFNAGKIITNQQLEIEELKDKLNSPTPQTGRTYTEGEVEKLIEALKICLECSMDWQTVERVSTEALEQYLNRKP